MGGQWWWLRTGDVNRWFRLAATEVNSLVPGAEITTEVGPQPAGLGLRVWQPRLPGAAGVLL